MKDRVSEELKTATFHVDLTCEDAIFYADPNDVQAVIGRLQQHHNLTDVTLLKGGLSSESSPRLPVETGRYGNRIYWNAWTASM